MVTLRRRPAFRGVFLLGVPRSGSTWIGSVLSRAPGAVYVNEPDNPDVNPPAAAALKGMWRRGPLAPDAETPPAFDGLWDEAFGLRRDHRSRRARAVVVKSVRAHLCAEWLAARYQPHVVVIRAHPLSVLASWVRLGWGGMPLTAIWLEEFRPDLLHAVGGWPADPIEQAAVEIGVKACLQEELLARHPDWVAARHEDLCGDPIAGFDALFEKVGLDFTDDVRAFVASTNAPGVRHDITRIQSEAARRWVRLDPDDRARALAILERLPLDLSTEPAPQVGASPTPLVR